jgi:glycerate kinase
VGDVVADAASEAATTGRVVTAGPVAPPGEVGVTGHVVVAPDSFKGSLTAAEVAACLAEGVRAVAPGARLTLLPMADGGEGSLAILASAWGVPLRPVATVDALGRPCTAHWAASPDGRVGIVELASASGLPAIADAPSRARRHPRWWRPFVGRRRRRHRAVR